MIDRSYQIAHAAGWDAADAHMRAAGRKVWDRSDYNECWRVFNLIYGPPPVDIVAAQKEKAQ